MRLIDALCEKCFHKNVCKFRENEVVECSHFIDPEELRPKGEWVQDENSKFEHRYHCSVCNHYLIDVPPNYYPNCGAKMRGAE